jgi:hypothetical protein
MTTLLAKDGGTAITFETPTTFLYMAGTTLAHIYSFGLAGELCNFM